MAETTETEELEGLCREICREMVPNWDIGAGPRPGPGATTRNTQRKGQRGGKDQRDKKGKSTQNMNHQSFKRRIRGGRRAEEVTDCKFDSVKQIFEKNSPKRS